MGRCAYCMCDPVHTAQSLSADTHAVATRSTLACEHGLHTQCGPLVSYTASMFLGLCARHVSGYYSKTQQLRTSLCGLVSAAANEVEVNQGHVAGRRHLQVGEVGDEAWSSALQRA